MLPADRERIAENVRRAYRQRDEADALEDEAQALLAEAMREGGSVDALARRYGTLAAPREPDRISLCFPM